MADSTQDLTPFLGRKTVVLKRTDTLREAALAMAENNIGCVLVANHDGEIVGLLTDRDLALTVAVVSDGVEASIHESMSEEIVTVAQESSLQDVIELMCDQGIRRVPVMAKDDPRSKCVGVVSLDDLLATQAITLEEARRIIDHQIKPPPRRATQNLEERIRSRREQTATRFRRVLGEELLLDPEMAEQATLTVLAGLIERIHYGEAKDLISQMPLLWQDRLFSVKAGPSKSITADTIVERLASQLDITNEQATELFARIPHALGKLISPDEILDVLSELPEDMRNIIRFKRRESPTHPSGSP